MTYTKCRTSRKSTKTRSVALGLLLLLGWQSVTADCTVNALAVAFGNYDVFSSTDLDGTGRVDVSCSPSASYTVSLGTGGGSYGQREMLSGATILNYNLYTNATRTTVWGDGSGITSTVSGSGVSASHTVYGRIPARQNKPAGSYTDVIVVTVTF